jgi:uncharacterized protein
VSFRLALSFVALVAFLGLALVARADTPLPVHDERTVYDGADVIEADDERALESLHRELFEKTGVAIVVVTVPELVDETIDGLALRIGESWGVGKKGEDRGIVVAFAHGDRKVHVATGYGVEGWLPDGRVGAILDAEALPAFRQDRFSAGLRNLSQALAQASADELGAKLEGATPEVRTPPPAPVGLVGTILGWAAFLLAAYFLVRRPGLLGFALLGGLGRSFGRGGSGFGGGGGFGGFGGGGFGGGGAGRSF